MPGSGVVGQAYYEFNARDAGLDAALQRADSKIKSAGTSSEQAFGRQMTGGLGKAETGLTRLSDRFHVLHMAGGTGSGVFGRMSSGLDQLQGHLDKTSRFTDKLGLSTKSVGGVMQMFGIPPMLGWAGAAAAAGLAAMKMVDAASSQQQAVAKTTAVFGQSSAAIVEWSGTTTNAFGISKTGALQAASGFGQLFTAAKVTSDVIPGMSMRLTELAGDMALFNDVPVADALNALRSGIVGEFEPLRRLGVMIDDQTLRQKALQMGLITTVKDGLTPATKAQATYALILEQTAMQQGEAARSADDLATIQQKAGAKIEDAMARAGKVMLPLAETIVPLLVDGLVFLVDVFGQLAGFVGTVASAIGGLGDFMEKAGEQARDFIESIRPQALVDLGNAWADWRENADWPLGQKNAPDWAKLTDDTAAGATDVVGGAAGALAAHDNLTREALDMAREIPKAVRSSKGQAVKIAGEIPGELSAALRDDRAEWQKAWDQLKDDAENSMSSMVEMAKIKGKLAKIETSKGWTSGDPVWIQSLIDTRQILQDRLDHLQHDAHERGARGGTALAGGFEAQRPKAKAAADVLVDALRVVLTGMPTYKWGKNTGQDYIDGLYFGLDPGPISTKMRLIARLMESSVRYPENPLQRIDEWGLHTTRDYVDKMVEGLDPRPIRHALYGMAGAFTMPDVGGVNAMMPARDSGAAVGLSVGRMAFSDRAGGVTIGTLRVDVDMKIARLNANDAGDVLRLGRSLGNEIRLSLTRSPAAFFRANG